MRSAILMGSAAMLALAAPAFALPDRYEQGYSCTGMGAQCVQERLRLDDGNRSDDKSGGLDGNSVTNGAIGPTSAARSSDDENEIGDEIGDAADDTGDEISAAADEAGDEIGNAADDAGDEISDAADDVGDAVGDAFD